MQGSWNFNLDRMRTRLEESVKRKTERATQKIYDSVVKLSPVDTGNFVSSWTVSEGRPVFVRREEGSRDSVLSAPRVKVRANSTFPVFYITNGQPYGQRLEYGWSDQAPQGMIRITMSGLR